MWFQIISMVMVVSCVEAAVLKDKCRHATPQDGVDWSKLKGEWFNMMFVKTHDFFVSCRKMNITGVDEKEKAIEIKFPKIVYNVKGELHLNREIKFNWFENPGVVYATVEDSDAAGLKKAIGQKSNRTSLHYILTSTDYEGYIVLLHCGQNDKVAWVSTREATISTELSKHLNTIMSEYGFAAEEMITNSTMCH